MNKALVPRVICTNAADTVCRCPNSTGSDESRTPTLCLVCGEMLCSQSYCCQVEVNGSNSRGRQEAIGAASSHTKVCGAGTGIYLRWVLTYTSGGY